MTDPLKNRAYLHERHRLSHQQIDRLLGENHAKEFLPEKLKQLEAVKKFLYVTDLLTENGITYTCLKGPLLSFRIYNDPTVRISHDIDLLIDKKSISKVVAVLSENNFQFTEGFFWPQKEMQQKLFAGTTHHLSFYNQELNICVEIHWVLMHELPVTQKKLQTIITENITEIKFSGRTFTVFSLEFELLYLLIHGARHGWNRLKWLMDIRDYPFSQIDRQIFSKLTDQFHAWRIISQTNLLLKHFLHFGMPFVSNKRIPEYFRKYAFKSIENDESQRLLAREIFLYFRYLWYLFPSLLFKANILTSNLIRLGDITKIDSSFRIVYLLYRPYSFIRRRVLHV